MSRKVSREASFQLIDDDGKISVRPTQQRRHVHNDVLATDKHGDFVSTDYDYECIYDNGEVQFYSINGKTYATQPQQRMPRALRKSSRLSTSRSRVVELDYENDDYSQMILSPRSRRQKKVYFVDERQRGSLYDDYGYDYDDDYDYPVLQKLKDPRPYNDFYSPSDPGFRTHPKSLDWLYTEKEKSAKLFRPKKKPLPPPTYQHVGFNQPMAIVRTPSPVYIPPSPPTPPPPPPPPPRPKPKSIPPQPLPPVDPPTPRKQASLTKPIRSRRRPPEVVPEIRDKPTPNKPVIHFGSVVSK